MSQTHTREVIVEKDGQINLNGLPVRAGEHVRVLVIPEPSMGPTTDRYPLRGVVIRYDDPCEPATDPDDWEANR